MENLDIASESNNKLVRCKPIDVVVNEELATKLALEKETVFPLFESNIRDYKRTKRSSLNTNQDLRSRWKKYVNTSLGKTREPFQFPRLNDFHFINSLIKFDPSETVTNRASHRFRMKSGPGVDAYGQIPIANEMHLRKTT